MENGAIVVEGRGRIVTVCLPIVLDLDGDGLEYRALNNPVLMDPHHSGRYELNAWVGPDDGILIYDQNGDGIAQHDEWVLTTFVEHASTDLEALRAFDSNRDGVFNASDALFGQMRIGRDLNQNGHFEAGEVKTLSEHGIVAINLSSGIQQLSTPDNPVETLPGVYNFSVGQFVRSNGTYGAFSDTAFRKTLYYNTVHSDSAVTVVSYGMAKAWIQTSAAGVSLSLDSAAYAGHTTFVDFFGNAGNDYVIGTASANTLFGGEGADSLFGGGGDDIIVGDYADTVGGNLQGGDGWDTLVYTSAEPLIMDATARSFETVSGGSGNDLIYATSGVLEQPGVILLGNDGNDDLRGHDGNDVLIGGAGADTYRGGNGDDIFIVDASDAWTSIFGEWNYQKGGDTVIVDGPGGFYFGNLHQQHVENFFGGTGNDTVYAGRTDSGWYLQPGPNRLGGGAGNDFLYGGAGNDMYFWQRGDGYDTFSDRDYGEIYGDVVALGENILPQDVTLSLSGSTIYVTIGGEGGGQITLHGFAAQYGPADMLFVDDKFYDLNYFRSTYMGPISLASMYPIPPRGTGGSTGGGGGGGGTGWGGGGGGGAIPPLVFDLDGDGFELIDAKKSGIFFDWDGDGVEEETGWVGPDDGVLFIDRNGDDVVTADEIAFGRMYGKNDGFVSDLEGLRAFDSNGNGSLDEADADFGQFGIWKDADSDAEVDVGEISSLQEIGLLALSLTGYQTGEDIKQGRNTLFATTDAVFADGTAIKAGDVFLSYSPGHCVGYGHAMSNEMLLSSEALVHIA